MAGRMPIWRGAAAVRRQIWPEFLRLEAGGNLRHKTRARLRGPDGAVAERLKAAVC